MAVDPDLRLSTQRALLGAISPAVRLVKVRRDADQITLATIVEAPLGEDASEALSIAATEIVANFPECRIRQCVIVSTGELPREDVLEEGWVFQRREVR
jgi:hypothetical protein